MAASLARHAPARRREMTCVHASAPVRLDSMPRRSRRPPPTSRTAATPAPTISRVTSHAGRSSVAAHSGPPAAIATSDVAITVRS